MLKLPLSAFAPQFVPDEYSQTERANLTPFFTNLDKSVYVPLIFSPELIGALCSRASRAAGDLRNIFLREFVLPFLNLERTPKDTDATWVEKLRYGKELGEFIAFIQKHPLTDIFSNPRARSFYITWLAQYGDDSIAQMAGMHVAYASLSQVAIKHPEDQRIGLAPIEKSTRYVAFGEKLAGKYRYYTDPTLAGLGLLTAYEAAMDNLFETYNRLVPKLTSYFARRFPEEKSGVIEKKAFDTLRGLLPMSALTQVAFFGNGQAFEYLINRSMGHPLGEIRWAAVSTKDELNKLAPSFLRRLDDPEKQDFIREYQEYLAGKHKRMERSVREDLGVPEKLSHASGGGQKTSASVRLVDFNRDGEVKVVTGMLYGARNNRLAWSEIEAAVRTMSADAKRRVIAEYLSGRTKRFQKVGRAFENANVRFEITMNIGAWRDLQRHRILTQQRQLFTCVHGYDIPPEIFEAGLESEFKDAISRTEDIYADIAAGDIECAQYAVAMAHRVRFMQYENLRQAFWEIELRTIPEGHPDYRHVSQQKYHLLANAYPLLVNEDTMFVNLGEYDFARRGQEEKIKEKLERLTP